MATPSGILEVRCAGCGETLEVERGLTEFACPDCGTPQALPPELMPPRPRRAIPLPGRGAPSAVSAAPSRVPCGGCGAILSVPHGPGHFACPICRTEIAPSLAAVVSVVAPPAAIPIMSSQPEKPSEAANSITTLVLYCTLTSHDYVLRLVKFSVMVFMGSRYRWTLPAKQYKAKKRGPSMKGNQKTRDPSPKQNLSEAPQIERTIADTDHISPTQHQCPQSVSNTLDNIDVTTPSAFLNHNMPQVERNPQYYSQMYSPENRWAQANPSSNSCYEHEIPKQCFDGIVQLDSSNEEVHSNLLEDQNQDMDGQLSQEACVGNNHLEPAQFKSHTKNLAGYGRQNKNGFICSSDNAKHHGDLSSGIGTWHQINLAASCSRPALPVLAATPLPTISSPSSFEKLSLNQSSPTPTTPHYQSLPLYSQDAHNGDMLSASVRKTSKKRRGRAPAVLMEPREEADRPVLTPNGTDWNVHPPCPKVTTTLSLLIKLNYPGTYVSVDTNETDQPCELVVYHWHQCPSDIRDTILDEFLKRYKWSPGQEEECQKIFDRKAVRQLVNLFCYEKQRARELVAKKAKRSLAVGRASRSLEECDDREDSEEQQGNESVLTFEHDDPLKWKPFVPEWMQPKWWEKLCDHWAKDEVMKVSHQKRKNRNAGNHPCNASGSRSIAMHQQLISMDNSRKPVFNIDPPTKINSDKGWIIDKGPLQTEDLVYHHTAEARDAQLGPHPVQEQVEVYKRGRYCRASGASEKAQIDSLSKPSPGCFSKQKQPQMFTQEQVQQMINQALQGLNETWEKKFLSLEQNMSSMSKSRVIQDGAKGPLVTVARDKQCQLACQDTLDSLDGEKDHPAGRGHDENQDYEDEHWS
ncbi:hypothetical protein GUJ93_ZPchr0458g22795 [Zizania palustris]|uniref:Uncharacterized protein n=1 Tax=Zizania palustris TaxID=103762 RepID=A0A8J5RDM1_ZIZPA|nr:hypothetical protein GUJ93_ZPchr0458g22795 [Zizania palustris]